jgi:hypothetical protein
MTVKQLAAEVTAGRWTLEAAYAALRARLAATGSVDLPESNDAPNAEQEPSRGR